jgi:hypothetical protein
MKNREKLKMLKRQNSGFYVDVTGLSGNHFNLV